MLNISAPLGSSYFQGPIGEGWDVTGGYFVIDDMYPLVESGKDVYWYFEAVNTETDVHPASLRAG